MGDIPHCTGVPIQLEPALANWLTLTPESRRDPLEQLVGKHHMGVYARFSIRFAPATRVCILLGGIKAQFGKGSAVVDDLHMPGSDLSIPARRP